MTSEVLRTALQTAQRSRARMVERLREQGVRDEKVLAAMMAVPRHLFVEEALASRAYEDTALPLGLQQTISQPFVVARMIESADKEQPYLLEDKQFHAELLAPLKNQLAGQLSAILRKMYGIAEGAVFPEGQPPVRSLSSSVVVQRPVGASLREAARRLYDQAFDQRFPDHPRFDTTSALTLKDFAVSLEVLRRSDAREDGRASFAAAERKSVQLVLGGLRVADVHESHLVFPSTTFATLAGQIDRALAESEKAAPDQGVLTVAQVVAAVEKLMPQAGLNRDCTTLLAAAWAESRDRSWFTFGTPVAAPAFKDIQQSHQLREPVLPEQGEWDRAVQAAQHLFGIPERGHLSPTNLTHLVGEAVAKADEFKTGSENLVEQLAKLEHRLGRSEEGRRLWLARRQTELLRTLVRKRQHHGEVVAALAAAGGARVVAAPPLPDGWAGKPWACHVGARQATGDVLVFLDADVVLGTDGLDRIVASWQRSTPDGLLSVQPFHTTLQAHEQLSAYPNLISMMASGAFAAGQRTWAPVAFGPCMVTSADAYRQVGGHEVVADEIIEDVHLARAYGAAGRPVAILAGGSAASFRMYPGGLRQLVDGWTKNLAGGPRLMSLVPMVGSVAWVLASIVIASDLVRALASAVGGELRWVPVAAWAVAAAQLTVLLRRIGRFAWWAGPAFPVLLAGFVALFVRSGIQRALRRSVRWRGRSVAVRVR